MILVIWVCMYVFYAAFLSILGLMAAGYLVRSLFRRRRQKVRPVPARTRVRGSRPVTSTGQGAFGREALHGGRHVDVERKAG